MRDPALDAWGDYDRDNPFPLFAQVRADGPVHEVTLPDGQRAWLIVRHAEARAALNDPRLSKDMHAALAHDGAVVAEGLPGPAFARHMLSVDPPDHTRLRGLAAAAFGRSRITALRPRVQAHRRRPARRAATPRRPRRRPGRGLRLPTAVHRDQRAARHPRAGPGRARRLVHHAAGTRLSARTAPERGRSLGEHRALPDRTARPQTRRAGRGPGHRPGARRRRT